jgi:hypothetical protein
MFHRHSTMLLFQMANHGRHPCRPVLHIRQLAVAYAPVLFFRPLEKYTHKLEATFQGSYSWKNLV